MVSVRRRRSSLEILGGSPAVDAEAAAVVATEKDEKARKLGKKHVNVSAGGTIYEQAKSRRTRHREVLMEHADDAVALKSASGSGEARGPNLTANTFTYRHCKAEQDPEEEKWNLKSQLRIAKLRDSLLGNDNDRNISRRRATTASPYRSPDGPKKASQQTRQIATVASKTAQPTKAKSMASRLAEGLDRFRRKSSIPKAAPKRKTKLVKHATPAGTASQKAGGRNSK